MRGAEEQLSPSDLVCQCEPFGFAVITSIDLMIVHTRSQDLLAFRR